MLHSHALAALTPRRVRGPKAWKVLGRLIRAEPISSSFPNARKRSAVDVCSSGSYHSTTFGGYTAPVHFETNAAVATITLTCLTHIFNDAGSKTHTEARFREFNVFHCDECLFGEQHKSARVKQQSETALNVFRWMPDMRSIVEASVQSLEKFTRVLLTNTLTLYIYGFFQIITSRTRKASQKNYVHITQ